MLYLSKALIISAFVVFGLPVFIGPAFFDGYASASGCPSPSNPQLITIRDVYDGDTLLLQDGRKVRLIGINTPEKGRDGQPDEPLAQQATAAVRLLVKDQTPLWLQLGRQPSDRYGRTLAHIFLADGRSLEAELLKQGLGFAISISPNLALRDCLNEAERVARKAELGVWSEPQYQPIHASTLNHRSGGFGRYQGEVSRAGLRARSPYLELNDKLYLPLPAELLQQLTQISSDDLLGRKIEVRGWLIARELSKSQKSRGFLPFMIKINHIDNLTLCSPDC